ncbi:MAG: hypothetical protein ACRD45_05075 [Bryobacteraceae bacterium]
MAMASGWVPTEIVAVPEFVAPSIADTVSPPKIKQNPLVNAFSLVMRSYQPNCCCKNGEQLVAITSTALRLGAVVDLASLAPAGGRPA